MNTSYVKMLTISPVSSFLFHHDYVEKKYFYALSSSNTYIMQHPLVNLKV